MGVGVCAKERGGDRGEERDWDVGNEGSARIQIIHIYPYKIMFAHTHTHAHLSLIHI